MQAGSDVVVRATLTADQKTVLVGRRLVSGDDDLLVVRVDPDGTLDEGFGVGGVVVTDVANRDDTAEAAALGPLGFVVVAGWVQTNGSPNAVVARYSGAGALDATFGSGGIVLQDVGGADDRAHAVVVRPDRRVLIAGRSAGRVLVVQYDDLGVADPTFGTSGVVTIDPTVGTDRAWAAALQPDGKVVLAGEASGDVLVARLLTTGALDPAFGIGGVVVRDAGGTDVARDVRVRGDGAILVAGTTTAGAGGDGFVLVLDAAGAPVGGFGASGLALSGLAGSDGLVAVGAGPGGTVAGAGWLAGGTDEDVLGVRFTAAGVLDAAFGVGGVVTRDFVGGNDRAVGMGLEVSGRMVIGASASNGADTDPGVVRLLGAPPAPGDEFQVNTYTTDYQFDSQVSVDGTGRFVVVWSSFGGNGSDASDYGIHAQRYEPNGDPSGPAFQVNAYTTGYQTAPAVASDAAGNFVVVWQSEGSPGTDQSGSSIVGRRFASSGAPVGAEFQVNTHTTGNQFYPRVAANAAGDFAVVWESDTSAGTDVGPTSLTSVQGRFFTSAGAPIGADLQLNTVTTMRQRSPVIAMVGADVVVAWDTDGPLGTDDAPPAVAVRRFSSDGVAAAPEVLVNSHTTGAQAYPGVAMGSDGRFVVVWHGDGPEDNALSGFGVFAQRHASDGTSLGGQFVVNDQIAGEQVLATVAYDTDHSFLVAWQGAGAGDGFGAFGRRFGSGGTPQGASFRLNRHTADAQQRLALGQGVGGDFVAVWETFAMADTDRDRSAVAAARFDGTTPFTTTTTLPGGTTTTTTTLPGGTTTSTTTLPGGSTTTTSTTLPGGTTTSTTTLPGGSTTTTSTTLPGGTTTTTLPGPPGAPLLGTKLVIKTKPGKPAATIMKAIAKDPAVSLGAGNGSLDDPVTNGGSARIALSGGFDGDFTIASVQWRYVKKPGKGRGYKAKGAVPIKTVVVKPGKVLKVVSKGEALAIDLAAEPAAIEVVVRMGSHRHCMRFVGAQTFVPGRKLVSKTAERPAACLP